LFSWCVESEIPIPSAQAPNNGPGAHKFRGSSRPGAGGVAKKVNEWCGHPDLNSPRGDKMGSTKNIVNKKCFVCSKTFKLLKQIR